MALALAKRLQGRQPLDAVQELAPQGPIRLVSPHAALFIPAVKHGGSGQGKNGKPQENQGYREIQDGHEDEYHYGRHGRDDELRQVLAYKHLQSLDPVPQCEDHSTGAALIEVAGPQGKAVIVEALSYGDLDYAGGVVGVGVLEVLEHPPDGD